MPGYIKNGQPPLTHYLPLDGLRGLAILLVATGHIFYKYYIFQFGWTGLNLFFVLSGYLITQRLFVHISSRPAIYFRNFYARRIFRIFPLYYGCLLFFLLVLPLGYNKYHQHFDSINKIQVWYWLYISNWRYFLYGLPGNPIFFHFWSLAVEEQFYLLWPLIFLLVTTVNKRTLFIALFVSLSLLLRIFNYRSGSSYYSSFTGAEPLLLGCLISILQKNSMIGSVFILSGRLAFLSFLCLIFILFRDHDLHTTNQLLFSLGYLNIDLIWSYLLIFLLIKANKNTLIYRISVNRLLIWLGIYSYGIYVFHWIVLQLFVYTFENWLALHNYGEIWAYWLSRISGIAFIILISYWSYHLFEKKFLLLKKYFI